MDSTVEHGEAAEGSLPRVVGYQLWARLISGSKGHDGRREQRGGCFAGKARTVGSSRGGVCVCARAQGGGAVGSYGKCRTKPWSFPEAQ